MNVHTRNIGVASGTDFLIVNVKTKGQIRLQRGGALCLAYQGIMLCISCARVCCCVWMLHCAQVHELQSAATVPQEIAHLRKVHLETVQMEAEVGLLKATMSSLLFNCWSHVEACRSLIA